MAGTFSLSEPTIDPPEEMRAIHTFANIEGHTHVRQVTRHHLNVLQKLWQCVCYQQEVIAVRLYQGRHGVAGITLALAGKAPQSMRSMP